jgi:hypothetical protein
VSYPHRVTLDLDEERYRFLQWVGYEKRSSLADLMRATIDILREDKALLERVAALTSPEPPKPPERSKQGGRQRRNTP